MQFPNPSSLPVISEEKSCRRIKFSLQDDKKNEKWMWTRKKTRGEEKTRRERGKKKRKIFQYKRNNYRRSWYGDGKRMVQMKPPKFQHPLRPPPTLLLLLRLLFAFLSLPRSLYTLAPVFSIPGALSLPGASSSVPFLPVPFPLSVGEPMPSQSAGKVESRRRWRRIRETRGASAGVAMTQSQRGPMDLAGVREVFGGPRLGVARAEGCVARGAHHLRHSLRGGMPKCAPGCNIIPLGG